MSLDFECGLSDMSLMVDEYQENDFSTENLFACGCDDEYEPEYSDLWDK